MSRNRAAAVRQLAQEARAAQIARGRNTLKMWLHEHHDELLAEIGGKPVDWESYLGAFTRRGLTDADGNPPTVTTAMQTWYRVRKAVAAERARKQAASATATPALRHGEIAPGVKRLEETMAAARLPPAIKLELRAAQPLSHPMPAALGPGSADLGRDNPAKPPSPDASTTALASVTTAPEGEPGHEDPDAQIQRLLTEIRANKTRMPQPM